MESTSHPTHHSSSKRACKYTCLEPYLSWTFFWRCQNSEAFLLCTYHVVYTQHDMVQISNTIYILVIVFVFVLSLYLYLSFSWCGYKSCFLLKSRGIIYIPYCRVHIEGEYIKYSAGALQNIVIGILSKNLHIYGKWDL